MQLFHQAGNTIPNFDPTTLATYLSPNIPRHAHILGVVNQMQKLLSYITVPTIWHSLLIQACYLHDIGYSPQLQQYNYHQLDGAIFAAKQGFPKEIVATILFHSCAYEGVVLSRPDLRAIYANHLHLLDEKDHFFIDLVSYCDLHTSAFGEAISFEKRVSDVAVRYGNDHEVTKVMNANVPHFETIIARVQLLKKR